MATNLRTIHVGTGHTTDVAANTYASWQDFRAALYAGLLPLDLRAGTGVDEDWDVLLYGDGINPIYFSDTISFSQIAGFVGDSSTTIRVRPAPGHGFADVLDPATDALTFHGPSKGITICPTVANKVFLSVSPGAYPGLIVEGLQFHNQGLLKSYFVTGNTDTRQSIRRCIVWDTANGEALDYSDGPVENCLLFVYHPSASTGRVIDGKSNSNLPHYIRNNIIADARAAVSETAIYSYHGDNGKQAGGNIFCGPWASLMESNRSWTTTANLISGAADASGQFTVAGGNRFNIDPRDVFQKFTPGSIDPADYDFRLKAGSPAIGAASGYPVPEVDIYGRARSAVTHIGPAESVVSSVAASFDAAPSGYGRAVGGRGQLPTATCDFLGYVPQAARASGHGGSVFASTGFLAAATRGHACAGAEAPTLAIFMIALAFPAQARAGGGRPGLALAAPVLATPGGRMRRAARARSPLHPSAETRRSRPRAPSRTVS